MKHRKLFMLVLQYAVLDRDSLRDAFEHVKDAEADKVRQDVASSISKFKDLHARIKRRSKKYTPDDDNTLRLAFIYGEQWAEGVMHAQVPGSDEYKQDRRVYEKINAFRLKQWGKSQLEKVLEHAPTFDEFLMQSRQRTVWIRKHN